MVVGIEEVVGIEWFEVVMLEDFVGWIECCEVGCWKDDDDVLVVGDWG